MIYNQFPKRLRDARIRAGMSQTELAERADLSVRSISMYETGASSPRMTTVYRLAVALGVCNEYFTDDAFLTEEELKFVEEYDELLKRIPRHEH